MKKEDRDYVLFYNKLDELKSYFENDNLSSNIKYLSKVIIIYVTPSHVNDLRCESIFEPVVLDVWGSLKKTNLFSCSYMYASLFSRLFLFV